AFEGFTLSRATGVVDPFEATLWHHEEQTAYEVLATSYGEDLGWEGSFVYAFELLYTATLIEVRVDGSLVFSLSSTEAGAPFEAGRFGFYNFSQPSVRYADFAAATAADP
ncbi:MAG: hypothetical protein ACOC1F_03110, partial [Myxococcota bacterium]